MRYRLYSKATLTALKKLKHAKDKEFKAVLEEAEEITRGMNPFVESCRKFYEERGFLSDKQVEALRTVEAEDD